ESDFLEGVFAGCDGTGGLPRERLGCGRFRLHVGQHMGDGLVGADGPPELLALLCVGAGEIDDGLCRSAVSRGRNDALDLKAGQKAIPALVFAANDAAVVDANIREKHFIGAGAAPAQHVQLVEGHAGRIVVDEEKRHAVAVVHGGIGLEIDAQGEVARAGASVPNLLAVHDETFAVANRAGADIADIRSRFRLRNRNRHAPFAVDEFRKPIFFLLFGALAQDVESAKHAAAERHLEVDAVVGDLMHDDREIGHRSAGAAVLFREGHTEQAGIDPGLVQLVRIGIVAFKPADVVPRCMLFMELPHAIAKQLLLGIEAENHAGSLIDYWREELVGVSRPSSARISWVCSPCVGGGVLSRRAPSTRIGERMLTMRPSVGWTVSPNVPRCCTCGSVMTSRIELIGAKGTSNRSNRAIQSSRVLVANTGARAAWSS